MRTTRLVSMRTARHRDRHRRILRQTLRDFLRCHLYRRRLLPRNDDGEPSGQGDGENQTHGPPLASPPGYQMPGNRVWQYGSLLMVNAWSRASCSPEAIPASAVWRTELSGTHRGNNRPTRRAPRRASGLSVSPALLKVQPGSQPMDIAGSRDRRTRWVVETKGRRRRPLG